MKEEANPPPPAASNVVREVHLEITGLDFDELTDRIRRLRQNYNARRRRVESRNPLLKSTRERWKREEKELAEITSKYNHLYNLEVKRVEERLPFRTKKRQKDQHARRVRALRGQYERMLEQVMGETPPLPLEQILVEGLGGALE